MQDAKAGDPEAQLFLGVADYTEWQRTYMPQYLSAAVHWTRRAAGHGLPRAEYNIGLMRVLGQGVPRNVPRGIKWLRRSAKQNDADAQGELGLLYSGPTPGLPRDRAAAFLFFREAAHQNNSLCEYYLARAYAHGWGTPVNPPKAKFWMQKAAAADVPGAQAAMAAADQATPNGVPAAAGNATPVTISQAGVSPQAPAPTPASSGNSPALSNMSATPAAGGPTSAAQKPQKSWTPFVKACLIGKFSVVASDTPDWMDPQRFPPHVKTRLTPAAMDLLAESIAAMPLTLLKAPDGSFTGPGGTASRDGSAVAVTMPLAKFSATTPRPYDLYAMSSIVHQIHRFVDHRYFRYAIDENIEPLGIVIHWPDGLLDQRHASPHDPQSKTRCVWAVQLSPSNPFMPPLAGQGASAHRRHFSIHFENRIAIVLGTTAGYNILAAGKISPNDNNNPVSETERPVSRRRQEAMGWRPMPLTKMRRLAHAGNAIAEFNLGRMYLDKKQTRHAEKWLWLAADQYNGNAEVLLASLEYNGILFDLGEHNMASMLPSRSLDKVDGGMSRLVAQQQFKRENWLRQMRRLRDQARTSWTALYQLDTYAHLGQWNFVTGNNDARCFMGTLYDPARTPDERVVPKSRRVAILWYRAVADRRKAMIQTPTNAIAVAYAETALGISLWRDGDGISQPYLLRAAKSGLDPAAMNDYGVANNTLTAQRIYWLRKAAMRGDATAQRNLAVVYKREAQPTKAVRWYLYSVRQRSMQGHQQGYLHMRLAFDPHYILHKKEAIATLRWYCANAPSPAASAEYHLAMLYVHIVSGPLGNPVIQIPSHGGKRKLTEAVGLLTRATAQGYAPGEYALGVVYADGQGVTQNNQSAVHWWKLAAAQGNAPAKKALLHQQPGLYNKGSRLLGGL